MPPFTKQAIVASFLKLLGEKPLHEITVKDIVEDCGVNRKTFYYYFKDVYDLVDEVFQAERKKVRSQRSENFLWEDSVLRMLQFVLENKKASLHIYNSISYKKQEDYLFQVSREFMLDFVHEQGEGLCCTEADVQLLASFYAAAISGMVLEWMGQGMEGDPVKVVGRLGVLLEGTARLSLQNSLSPKVKV